MKRTREYFWRFRYEAGAKLTAILAMFLFFNTLKSTLYGHFITNPSSYTGSFFYGFLMLFAVTTPIYTVIFLLKSRFVFIASYFFQMLYILANLAYYLYFHNYLHLFQTAVLFTEGLDAAGHFAVPKSIKLLIVLLDFPLFIYLVYSYKKIQLIIPGIKSVGKQLLILSTSYILLIEGWNFLHNYSFIHILRGYPGNEVRMVERYGTVINNAVDIWINRNDQKLINSITYGETIRNEYQINKNKANFIIIQVESMDSNIIHKKYKGKEVMPFISSISTKCVYYPYTLSYHKAGGTSDSEISMFNSIEPLDNFPLMKINSYMYPNSFVRILADNSYYTAAFHGNISSYFSRNKAYPKIGFKAFHDMTAMNLKDVGWGAPDMDVFKYTAKQLALQDAPFFYHIITMTSHGPFTNASYYYNNTHYKDIKDVVVRDYFNSMSYVDQSLKFFINSIKQQQRNTYIIIIGDHTPSIKNNIFNQASFYLDNKYFEFVPLMILTPDNKIYKEEKNAASFLDIAPTILYNSGLSFKLKSSGINLLRPANSGKIPYKGQEYDRAFLFKQITSE